MCDWDYDGLRIFDLVKKKIPQIELLFPNATPVSIIKSEHDSHWKNSHIPHELSNLNKDLFDSPERQLIELLISSDSWIVEESNDIAELIKTKVKL